jgi:hypothetical protein
MKQLDEARADLQGLQRRRQVAEEKVEDLNEELRELRQYNEQVDVSERGGGGGGMVQRDAISWQTQILKHVLALFFLLSCSPYRRNPPS